MTDFQDNNNNNNNENANYLNVVLNAFRRNVTISSTTTSTKVSTLKQISMKEVSDHDSYDDCWIVLYDLVYDVTTFLDIHPGSMEVIMDYAGRDATFAFADTGHNKQQLEILKKYLIGELPMNERLIHFRGLFNMTKNY